MDTLRLTPVSKEIFFKGRPGDPRLGEWVETPNAFPEKLDKRSTIFLYGCPDDTGVVLNRGRAGARLGPDSIRKYLYKMALPMDLEIEKSLRFIDLGNIETGTSIVETHRGAELVAERIASAAATLIALGGGHDFAAPNVMGWANGLGLQSKKGLINVDPHLDLRPLEGGSPHSGSPFRQILESNRLAGKDLVEFGARTNRNAREHFLYAKKRGIKVITFESLREKDSRIPSEYRKTQKALSQKVKHLALTIDLDSYMEGEGSSAAPVIGFSGNELYSIASSAGQEKKISYFEVAEVAPELDPHERTSRLAAELVFSFLYARAKSLKKA